MSPQRALRLALEKTADEDLSLALTVSSSERTKADHAGLIALIPDAMMLILIDGPDGATGMVALDAAILASLIEVQTMGQVLSRPAPVRALTRTDAALATPLVDGVLTRVTGHLSDHPDRHWACGYRFGAMIEDRRSLGLALTAPDYHVFRLPLDIGPGIRMGEMVLALPVRPDPAVVAGVAEQVDPSRQLQDRVLAAPARLDAILCRLHLPLSEIGALSVGDVLAVPQDAIREISIEVAGARRLATARLGKLDGLRALRLNLSDTFPDHGQGTDAAVHGEQSAPQAAPQAPPMPAASLADAVPEPAAPGPRARPADGGADGGAEDAEGSRAVATATMDAFQAELTGMGRLDGDPMDDFALSMGTGPAAA